MGNIKNIASKAGLTSSPHSLRSPVSEAEEDAIVTVCLLRVRQGKPLTIPALVDLVSFFAGRDEEHHFSRHFVYNFIDRHKNDIILETGKITSPTRSMETMLQKTKEFISEFQLYVKD